MKKLIALALVGLTAMASDVYLTWEPMPNWDLYRVYGRNGTNHFEIIGISFVNATYFTVTNAPAGTNQYYVRGHGLAGDLSEPTETVTIVVPVAPKSKLTAKLIERP